MKKIKALGIAPYEGIKKLMDKISLEKNDIDIITFTANLEEAIEILNNSQERYEVIISRGGTAKLLEQYVDIPVVEISFTVYDILRSMNEAESHTGPYSIVGYPNLTNTAKELCSILNNNTEIFTTYSHESVETTLELLEIKEVNLILADTVNYEEANKRGIKAILVASGEESINIAFNEAIKIGKVYRSLQYENSMYKSLQLIDDHIYYILDAKYNLVYQSIHYMDESIMEILKEYAKTISLSEEKSFFFFFSPNYYHCKIKCVYLSDEILYLVRVKVSNYSNSDFALEVVDKKQALEDYLSSFYNITNSIGNMGDQIKLASSSHKLVLLIGEVGTGKTEVAKRIYSISKYSDNPLYILDLTSMDIRTQKKLFNNPDSPLFETNSSFFIKLDKNIDLAIVNELLNLIKNSRFTYNNKCIISYQLEFNEKGTDSLSQLINNIDCIPMDFAPLRQYKSDIISLANIYLNEKNSSTNKYILGFDKKAIDLLKNYIWPQNFIQLWRVLDQLIEDCKGDYISESMAKKLIETERNIFPHLEHSLMDGPTAGLNFEGTLDEITREIILISLNNNDNNKTKTAEKLGISRSTLWRYLK